jgi:eukaryotic-like serine/threonine-protein kinase
MTSAHTLIAGRYELLEPLGQGGMGRVWRARDNRLNRIVAIKEVVGAEGLTPADVAELGPRALREARAAARLNHHNVVKVYDIEIVNSVPWIVMEYVPSRSLFAIVATDGLVPAHVAARYGLDVLAALTAAHQAGVLHRDVKPANVLITETGRAVLSDFGLATVTGDPSVTRSGLIIGSPSFMAPERASGVPAGPEADLWSLGATLYFAVEGRSPYERGSVMATLAALAHEDPPYAAHSGTLWPVLEGLLRRRPKDRLSAPAARTMLRRATEVPRPMPPPLAVTPAKRRRPLAYLGAAVVALLLVLAFWLVPQPKTSPHGAGTSVAPTAAPTTAVSTPTPTPVPTETSATPAPTSESLPPGWHTYVDRTGFSVAVPMSWTVSRRGSIVYFDEPGGGRLLGIDQTDHPQPDPVADWRGKEQYRVARGDFPSYRRVRLVAVDYFLKAADWEFTYVRNGVRLHVNNRGFITSAHQAYGMWWSTPDSDWDRFLPDLRLIERSFRPA